MKLYHMRFTAFILCVLFMLPYICVSAYAADNSPQCGDIIGDIYSTDIITYIDGAPIASCNIGGRTAVTVEELSNYGFLVEWDEKARTLYAYTDTCITLDKATITKLSESFVKSEIISGRIIGHIYATDIKMIFNGVLIPSYNVGGRTVVVLEDFGFSYQQQNYPIINREIFEITGRRGYDYSETGIALAWDPVKRTLNVKVYRDSANTSAYIADFGYSGEVTFGDIINYRSPAEAEYGGSCGIYLFKNPENDYYIKDMPDIDEIEANTRYGFYMNENLKDCYYKYKYADADGTVFSGASFYDEYGKLDCLMFRMWDIITYMGFEYNFDCEVLDIRLEEKQPVTQQCHPVELTSAKAAETLSVSSPVNKMNVKIAVNGAVKVTSDEMYTVLYSSQELYVNVMALEKALGVSLFDNIYKANK